MKIPKNYDHEKTEDKIYQKWEESGFFNPDNCIKEEKTSKNAPSFSMVLPPPNVTGVLHLGHASILSVEDILVRFHRMRGYKTLWVPGTDHAAIATQSKVESIIQKKTGKNRHDLGKEEFLKRVKDYAAKSHKTIVNQIKKMGASVDWSREAYTLDEKRNEAVVAAFKKLYDLGLIYRGIRIVNWDPRGQTTISDDEVVYKEKEGTLYTFYYDKDFPIPIATTRPETKLGDTAIAVNPNDKRYKRYIGKTIETTFMGHPLQIKIVGDKEIDPEFGTGAVGVTPAHSFTDWEIAQRHNLEVKPVINKYAKMTAGGEISGMSTKKAREWIVKKLKKEDLLKKEEEIEQSVATAERTGGIVEPLPKMQWFIDVNKEFVFPHDRFSGVSKGSETTLKELMKKTVEKGIISIIPEQFEKTYFHWIDNLRDWCISRQIWFGHQIPVWYREEKYNEITKKNIAPEKKDIFVGKNPPEKEGWVQDPDTLDTWFSSGLWTFSTLGWPHFSEPKNKSDFANYHPTTVLQTGYDILFFWVARMILMSSALIGDIPFRYVYLQGMVRDEKGRKMSKSLGNSLDPINVAKKYGTDALRMSLVVGSAPGNDIKISEPKIKAQKHFANKIWNAARFTLSILPEEDLEKIISKEITLTKEDALRIEELKRHIKEVTEEIESFRLYIAADKIYHYFWHTFADIVIEERKDRIYEGEKEDSLSAIQTIYIFLTEQLKIIHPFMPFITEELWSLIPHKKGLLFMEKWPQE